MSKGNKTYYYELQLTEGSFCCGSDEEAVNKAKAIAQVEGDDLLMVYHESATSDGLPFIPIYEE